MIVFIYGIGAYAIGLAGLTFFLLFVGGWSFMPWHVNLGTPGSFLPALIVNAGLIVLFGVQHSVMARQPFKQWLTKVIPPAAERSTYVLLSGILMALICVAWQPMQGVVWATEIEVLKWALWSLHWLGWGLAVFATFLINHFDLFGLRQVYLHWTKAEKSPTTFTERSLYKIVRHPLQLGFLLGLWSTPEMTVSRLVLVVSMTFYIFVGLYFEEKDLVATLGDDYQDYRRRVRMLIPLPKRGP